MFCPNCGEKLDDAAKFCPNCGEKIQSSILSDVADSLKDVADEVMGSFSNAESELHKAASDVKYSMRGDDGEVLQTDRSLLTFILLSVVTCGIYGYYFIYKMAHDINIACEGDGEVTNGLVAYIILSWITCGLYSVWWVYKLGNRLAANAPRYGLSFQENGTTLLIWNFLGALVCGIGPFIAMHIMIKNTNAICFAYNEEHGYND